MKQDVTYCDWNEHIRKKPQMYLERLGDGSHLQDGIYVLLEGIFSKLTEYVQPSCGKQISVEAEEHAVTVRHYGRGLCLNALLRATGDFSVPMGSSEQAATLPLIMVANAMASDFYVASYREGECAWVKYAKGYLLDKGTSATTESDGSFIRFVPDNDIFPGYSFRQDIVADILAKRNVQKSEA